MKKIQLILLSAILLVSITSCKDKAPETASQGANSVKSESVSDQIKSSYIDQKKNLNESFVKSFDSSDLKVIERYVYTGGEMEPSEILLLSSGIMVLTSKIFTENVDKTFFQYELMNEGKLLKVKFVDSRLNFNDYADMENSSASVFKIDKNDSTIIYHIKNNGFFFFNWGFYKE